MSIKRHHWSICYCKDGKHKFVHQMSRHQAMRVIDKDYAPGWELHMVKVSETIERHPYKAKKKK